MSGYPFVGEITFLECVKSAPQRYFAGFGLATSSCTRRGTDLMRATQAVMVHNF
jgi:hypothetical protein